jgi:hypothetical protein
LAPDGFGYLANLRRIAIGYRKIFNLHRDPHVLQLLKTVWSLEKIHGTSGHISYEGNRLRFFSGGATHERFVELFDQPQLLMAFGALGHGEDCPIVVFGEIYGAKLQKMRATYGDNLSFVAFEVKIDQTWLNVPNAADVARKLGLDFVPYMKVPCTLAALDWARDMESHQAIKNHMGGGHPREGIVIRPLEELRYSSGDRVMVKHKAEAFRESRTRQPRPFDPDKAESMRGAVEYSSEYIVQARLDNILSRLKPEEICVENTGMVIKLMMADVLLEEPPSAQIEKKDLNKALGRAAAQLFQKHIRKQLEEL